MTKKYRKCHFFDVLAIGNSNAFGYGGQTIKKVNFDRFRNFGQKKSQLKSVYPTVKVKNGEK